MQNARMSVNLRVIFQPLPFSLRVGIKRRLPRGVIDLRISFFNKVEARRVGRIGTMRR
jgi:hypothetical protein